VKNMLLAEGVHLDGYGGEVPYVEVSGLTGKGLDNLMETISLVSELMELRAERESTAVGYILESKIVKGFGCALRFSPSLWNDTKVIILIGQ
jgi:translation initiation factor IF-2